MALPAIFNIQTCKRWTRLKHGNRRPESRGRLRALCAMAKAP
jgi:hypothetical protein